MNYPIIKESSPKTFNISPLYLNSYVGSLRQLREWFEEAEKGLLFKNFEIFQILSLWQKGVKRKGLESGSLKEFSAAEGEEIANVINALEHFKQNNRIYGRNRDRLPVRVENTLLAYQREIDSEVDLMWVLSGLSGTWTKFLHKIS